MEIATNQNTSDVVLDLNNARPLFSEGGLVGKEFNLRLLPRDCVLIECKDPFLATSFADFCSGMIDPVGGTVSFLDLDWQQIDEDRANALRGLIGRVSVAGGWVERLGMDLNIIWQQLYHTEIPIEDLTSEAGKLALEFGMPGIPVLNASRLSEGDRRRCQWVRAFLGSPRLLILEYPFLYQSDDQRATFLKAVCNAQNNGASTIWFAKDLSVWNDERLNKFPRYRLDDDGLTLLKGTDAC